MITSFLENILQEISILACSSVSNYRNYTDVQYGNSQHVLVYRCLGKFCLLAVKIS